MTAALATPALASQAAFRGLMEAFARPGEIKTLHGVDAPAPLARATAAIVQALADYETPIWLDGTFASVPDVADWIRFQTGAAITPSPDEATFALISAADDLPDFMTFALGTEEYPDRSTTLIVQMERFAGPALTMEGPGIKSRRELCAEPLPVDFAERLRANRELFPRGVDLLLVADTQVVALPRSIRVARGA